MLSSNRIILRRFKESDLNQFHEYAKVEGVGEMAGWTHHKSIEESKYFLNILKDDDEVYAIVLKSNNKVIGSIATHDSWADYGYYKNMNIRELGYVIAKEYWGLGIAVEASKLLINYCFDFLDAITVCHFIDNFQSKRVVEKCGFIYVKDDFFNNKKQRQYIKYNTKKINITNGEIFNDYFKKYNECCVPFNENMMYNTPNVSLFSDGFVEQRIKTHNVTKKEYFEKLKKLSDVLIRVNEYNEIKLWFGDDVFCVINLLFLLNYLSKAMYCKDVILNIIDEGNYEIKNILKIDLKDFNNLIFDEIYKQNIFNDAIKLYKKYLDLNSDLYKILKSNISLDEKLSKTKEYGLTYEMILEICN